jgi:hypothetical protein
VCSCALPTHCDRSSVLNSVSTSCIESNFTRRWSAQMADYLLLIMAATRFIRILFYARYRMTCGE